MEPTQTKVGRYILTLGKYRVLERSETQMKIALGGSTTMTVTLPSNANIDVRTGDLLTFYTEVLVNANPQPPSIQ